MTGKMHPYATDIQLKQYVPFSLGIISISLAWVIHAALRFLGTQPGWWIDAPSVMSLFGGAYTLFDRIIWKWDWLKRLGITSLPDLNGTWQGYVQTSHDCSRHYIDLHISQTWSHISIMLSTGESTSVSETGAIFTTGPHGSVLCYEYINQPSGTASKKLQMHRGTVRLQLSTDGTEMQGSYYTNPRERGNYGEIFVRRQ